MAEGNGVVVDQGKWEWSEMWKKEDWWAIWLGFFILLAAASLLAGLTYAGSGWILSASVFGATMLAPAINGPLADNGILVQRPDTNAGKISSA